MHGCTAVGFIGLSWAAVAGLPALHFSLAAMGFHGNGYHDTP